MFTEEMKTMAGSHVGWRMSMEEEGCRKGPWTAEEDVLLYEYVNLHGEGRWNSVSRLTGLKRNGKSCRLRWVNYLRPDLKRGHITPYEESIILDLHAKWGNRWSTIARSLPGRTDNEIKNYWRTHFKKKNKRGASYNGEKPKNRSVKQQKQIHLQHHHHHHHHHHNQQELNQVQTETMAGWADEQEEKTESVSQMEQEMNTLCLHPSEEQQGLFFSAIGYQGLAMAAEASSEDLLWDGLWNLDY